MVVIVINKPSVVVHFCNPNMQRFEARGLQVQSQLVVVVVMMMTMMMMIARAVIYQENFQALYTCSCQFSQQLYVAAIIIIIPCLVSNQN